MTDETKKILKEVMKNEISPLLIGLRNDIAELTKVHNEGMSTPIAFQFTPEAIKEFKHHDGKTPKRGTDYFTDEDIKNFKDATTPRKGKDYFTAVEVEEFKASVTPVKGVDYSDGATPIKGTDYFTEADIKEFLSRATPIKGIHYRDGTDGTPGEKGADGTKITAEQIRSKLESLKGSARLSVKAIKGLEEKLADHFKEFSGKSSNQSGGMGAGSDVGGATYLSAGTNVTITGTGTQADPYIISSSGGGGGSYTFSTGLTDTGSTITANLSTGISGGQSVIGGIAASETLTLSSTSHATKGSIIFGTSSYNEVANTLGIGTTASTLHKLVMADTALAGSGSLAGSLINMTQTWNTTGSPTSILLNVTNTASGALAKLIDLQVGGITQFNVSKSGFVTANSIIESLSQVRGSSFRITLGNSFIWNGGSQIKSATDGIIQLLDSAGTDFTRLTFGGTTSSFPSIKRNGTAINFRLADDSADASITAGSATLSGASTIADTVGAGSGSLAGSMLSMTQTWNTSGNPTAIKLNVTNTASGAAALLMDLQVGGVSQFKVDKIGSITLVGSVSAFNGVFAGLVRAAAASKIQWASSTSMGGAVNGTLLLTNNAATDFTSVQYGGTTSSFPAHKKNGATIETRLADDSGFAAVQSLYHRFGSGTPEGAVTAPIGAIFHRTDGGAATSFYVKESGAGNTGWVAK